MDPRYRFAVVLSLVLCSWWGYSAVQSLLTTTAPPLLAYLNGAALLGSCVATGFGLVWLTVRALRWHQSRANVFDPDSSDEFGSQFEMSTGQGASQAYKLGLSKFAPLLIAPPPVADPHTSLWPGLTPLESELVGFLQGYRQWPADINHPETSLYEQAVGRWQVVRNLPGTGPWHRVAALASNLSVVHAYQEQRRAAPWWRLWEPDTVTWKAVATPQGTMTALLLSTMPAFRALEHTAGGADIQRALLTALRYQHTPAVLPTNTPPLTRQLIDCLLRANAQLKTLDIDELDRWTPARHAALATALEAGWPAVLADVNPVTDAAAAQPQALKLATTMLALPLNTVMERLQPHLNPELRELLQLWEGTVDPTHPAWAVVGPMLLASQRLLGEYDGLSSPNGSFGLTFTADDNSTHTWPHAVLVNVAHPSLAAAGGSLTNLPIFAGTVQASLPLEQLTARAHSRAAELDARLSELL